MVNSLLVRLQRSIQVLATLLILVGAAKLLFSSTDRKGQSRSNEHGAKAAGKAETLRVYDVRDLIDSMLAQVPDDYDPRRAIERNWKEYTSIEYGAARPTILDLSRRDAVIKLIEGKLERFAGPDERIIDGRLIVRQTASGHRDIARVLATAHQLNRMHQATK